MESVSYFHITKDNGKLTLVRGYPVPHTIVCCVADNEDNQERLERMAINLNELVMPR